MIRSYIWTLANRLSHLAMIVGFACAYFLEDFKTIFYYHGIFGLLFLLAIVFRLIWGWIGTNYSCFKDFHFHGIVSYLTSVFGEKKRYIGHNPASSFAIILMLILGGLTALTGWMAWGIEEQSGLFKNLYFHFDIFKYLKKSHALFANLLLVVVVIHICGVLLDRFLHKNDCLSSMIDGYKMTPNYESVSLNQSQKIFCIAYLLFSFGLCFYLIYPQNLLLGNNDLESQLLYKNTVAFQTYKKECGSCHIAYEPYFLAKQSWKTLMQNLDNHFGDDASLEEGEYQKIDYLLQENSTEKFNTFFKEHLTQQDKSKIAFTQYDFFLYLHKEIPQKVFQSQEVKSRANCQSCHQNAENGVFARSQIDFKKIWTIKTKLDKKK